VPNRAHEDGCRPALAVKPRPQAAAEADDRGRELLTEPELIRFLRIDEVSGAANLHHVIENPKRMRSLPCIYICNRPLYPRAAILRWVEQQTTEVRP
jgi:hypothetical protein